MARQGQRRSREEESIQRRASHSHPEGVGSRYWKKVVSLQMRRDAVLLVSVSRRRFGYRLQLLLREGRQVNHKRGYQLYVEE
jgi:hypothetical protein